MAKTQRKKKTKKQIFMDETRLRLFAVIALFVIIIAALRLGIVGRYFHYVIAFLTGNLYGIIYLLLGMLFINILIKAQIPRFTTPQATGLYMILLALFILMTYPSYELRGFDVLTSYLSSKLFNKGGFIGAFLFSLLSWLFDNLGTLIAGFFLLAVGISLLLAKIWVKYQSNLKKRKSKKSESINENVEKIILETKPRLPLFKKKQIVIFPDKVFEDEQIDKKEEIKPMVEQVKEEKKPFIDNSEKKIDVKINEKEEKIIKSVERKNFSDYQFPPLSLLKTKSTNHYLNEKNIAQENALKLTSVLRQFGVKTTVENVAIGPSITKYELKLEVGTRVNKILQLQDDIKLALATADIRIEAPIPGKPFVGIEVPNLKSSVVAFKDVYQSAFQRVDVEKNKLGVVLGKDISGKPIIAQLDKMPHLLIAGATGSGKSVCINTIITSLLMRAHPDEVKLILVDPKKVELSIYNGIPHLLSPVVTDPKKAAGVLREVVSEMERRYDVFASVNARNIQSYNDYAKEYNKQAEDNDKKEILPYQVIILDEVADLMMVASKEVEDCIMRISQMARAAGIHLIVATQRPSTDIITGVIKANIPSRIAFAVSSSIDSRTILDTSGAEKLLGKGDMLFSPMGSSSPVRVQGAYVSDEEVADIVHFVSQQREAIYEDKYLNVKSISGSQSFDEDENDEEYEQCREFVIQSQKASTSLLQRRFKIGYNKAARIIDQLEADGVIGPQNGSKPREVYIKQFHEDDF